MAKDKTSANVTAVTAANTAIQTETASLVSLALAAAGPSIPVSFKTEGVDPLRASDLIGPLHGVGPPTFFLLHFFLG